MTLSTFEAAKTLGHYSDWSLSNLEMQKILYIVHMFYMGKTGGQRLISESFEAWAYGPVLPSLYQRAKIFGSEPVKDIFFGTKIIEDNTSEASIIKDGCNKLSRLSPGQLVALTHRANGAWDKNYNPGARGIKIPDADILEEYKRL